MRRRFRRKPRKQALQVPTMRANERIRVPAVVVIDEKGEHRGEMTPAEGIEIARAAGLDLVEVSPKAKPPVCKVIDYGKFQYTQTKQARHLQAFLDTITEIPFKKEEEIKRFPGGFNTIIVPE